MNRYKSFEPIYKSKEDLVLQTVTTQFWIM